VTTRLISSGIVRSDERGPVSTCATGIGSLAAASAGLVSLENMFFMASLFPSIAIIIFYTHLLMYKKNCSRGDYMSAIKTYAVYKDGILVLEDPVNLPEHTRVEVVIRKKFSEFVKKFGEPEAKEDIDQLLLKNRRIVRDE